MCRECVFLFCFFGGIFLLLLLIFPFSCFLLFIFFCGIFPFFADFFAVLIFLFSFSFLFPLNGLRPTEMDHIVAIMNYSNTACKFSLWALGVG